MVKDFIQGILSYFEALKYIFRPSIFPFIFLTAFISLGIGTLVFGAVWHFAEPLGDWLSSFYKWEFGKSLIEFLSEWILRITLFILAFMLFRYIVIVLTAPIMSIISEKLEAILSSRPFPKVGIAENLKLIVRGLRLAIRNLTMELVLTMVLMILVLFTGLGIVLSPLIFIIQAYYAGFGNFDFFLERRFKFKESVQFMRSYKGMAVGNGLVFILLMMIPIVGFMLGPVLSTMAATIDGVRKLGPA